MKLNSAGTFTSVLLAVALINSTACNKGSEQTAANFSSGVDPANGNLAPVSDTSQTVSPAQPQSANYQSRNDQPYQQANPPQPQQPSDYPAAPGYTEPSGSEASDYEQPVEATQPPPPLPQYRQPECPGENYMWTPGYWSYSSGGYYWVPGTWVIAPYVGALWTPPYWDYSGNYYRWHRGYWGPHIGFYGGIDYGFGYTGRGYYGGYWNHGTVYYNRSVTNVNITRIHNVYNYDVASPGTRVSYNGGRGGIQARPTAPELEVRREQRIASVPAQIQHARAAAADRAQFAASNGGHPGVVVASLPLSTPYRAPAARAPEAAAARAPEAPPIRTRQEIVPRAPDPARPESNPRPELRQPAPGQAPAQAARPNIPEPHIERAAPPPAAQAQPVERQAPQARPMDNRRAPEGRPTNPENRSEPVQQRSLPERSVQQTRPQPENRAAPPQRQPVPEAQPVAPRPEAHPPQPAPQARPQAPPAPRQEAHTERLPHADGERKK
jgi:hypothetical protein